MHHTEDDKKTGLYIRKVLEFIQMNLSEELSLQRLSGIANYSLFHFQRIFTEVIGESPKQYIIRLRLERAAHYLKVFPGLTISDLADKSGFSSLATFSRAFQNFFSVSAVEYRKMTSVEKCRYWAGITFPSAIKLPKDASVAQIPDGIYANYRLNGNLVTTVKSLAYFSHCWLAENGYSIREILGYEVYSENPANKPSETIDREILIPVRPA